MKRRIIIQPKNFMDKFINKFMKKHSKTSTLTYRQLKEQEFRSSLQNIIRKLSIKHSIYDYTIYGSDIQACVRAFIRNILVQGKPGKNQKEIFDEFQKIIQFHEDYNAEFLYETNPNNEYDGKLYCLIRYNNIDERLGIYHVGNGLIMKNFIWLIGNKRISDISNSNYGGICNIGWYYITGIIIKHAYELIASTTSLPEFQIAYLLEGNSAEPQKINFFEWIKNKEKVFES